MSSPCRRGALSASLLEAAAKEGSRRQGGAGPWGWNQPRCPGGLSRILRRDAAAQGPPGRIWAAAGAEAANSRAAARAPAAMIQGRRGKDAILDRHRTTARVHSAVDQESLRAIELTRRLGPSRNGNVLGLTGP